MADDLLRLVLAHLNQGELCPIVVSGDVGSGKTRSCREIVREIEEKHRPGGVLSPRVIDSGVTTGYDVLNVASGEMRPFVRSDPPGEKVGRFFLRPGGLEFAICAITDAIGKNEPVFVDEVGRMELDGRGLAQAVNQLLESETQGIYLVRKQFLSRFREVFLVDHYDEFCLSEGERAEK